MKRYVFFNILIQLIILFIGVNFYFDDFNIKLLNSSLIIFLIFIPSIIEYVLKIRFTNIIHYIVTMICLLLFVILIAI